MINFHFKSLVFISIWNLIYCIERNKQIIENPLPEGSANDKNPTLAIPGHFSEDFDPGHLSQSLSNLFRSDSDRKPNIKVIILNGKKGLLDGTINFLWISMIIFIFDGCRVE